MNQRRWSYYELRLHQAYRFLIPPNKRLLFVDNYPSSLQTELTPSVYNVLHIDKNFQNIKTQRKGSRNKKYDFLVVDSALSKKINIMDMLFQIRNYCQPNSRVIFRNYNWIWQFLINFGQWIGFKQYGKSSTWLSQSTISVYLSAAGFEVTRIFNSIFCPYYFFGIGPFINFIATALPLFDSLKLNQFTIARPILHESKSTHKSLTICITVRNERDNIEPIVRSLPQLTQKQEILFVEGHSIDGTREEIRRVSKKYPSKNVRLIIQPNIGQGDATRFGFKIAKGKIIIIFEGDQTADPNDLKYVYKTMCEGHFEFILGSRLVYPLTHTSMPLLNRLGNIFFASWFSLILGQSTTDILCGIKAITKHNFLALESRWGFLGINDPFGDFELLFGAARLGLKIGEIPVSYKPRTFGKSKTHIFSHGWDLLTMALRGYWVFHSI